MKRGFPALCLMSVIWIAWTSGRVCAIDQSTDFPYEARVVTDDVYVRSGAGEAYYPTQRLSRDAVVRVHRHDPGGWYMIDPPDGSFSWVPERYVRRTDEGAGEITEDSIPAWVGSEFGDEISVFQRRLRKGEKLTILDSRTIDTIRGPQAMLKIAPPMRERRWIPGAALVPVDDHLRQKVNADPYRLPGNARRPDGPIVRSEVTVSADGSAAAVNSSNGVTDVPPLGPSAQLALLQQIRKEQQQLETVDQRFRDMILQDVSRWDLDSIEWEYRRLQQSVSHRPISGQIDLRFPAIDRYRRRLTSLMELRQLTTQTEMRDAELTSGNSYGFGWPGRQSGMNGYSTASRGPEAMMPPGEATQLATAFEAYLNRGTNMASGDGNDASADLLSGVPQPSFGGSAMESADVLKPGSPMNRFVGAGIVERVSSDGQASYVLMSPTGKILADLKPSGSIQLEQFVGRQVGVQGSRWSEQEKRDVIEVSAMEMVRLRN